MPWLSKGVCWASATQAATAHLSGAFPAAVQYGASNHNYFSVDCNGPTATGATCSIKRYEYTLGSGLVVRSGFYDIDVKLPTCSLSDDPASQFADGAVVGWGIVLVMVLAWKFRLMRSQAK